MSAPINLGELERLFSDMAKGSGKARTVGVGGLALTERLRAAEGAWQPIETAPRDGTLVMVGAPGCGVSLVRWMLDSWIDEQGFTQGSWPTHWRPLPPPPDTTTSSGGDHE